MRSLDVSFFLVFFCSAVHLYFLTFLYTELKKRQTSLWLDSHFTSSLKLYICLESADWMLSSLRDFCPWIRECCSHNRLFFRWHSAIFLHYTMGLKSPKPMWPQPKHVGLLCSCALSSDVHRRCWEVWCHGGCQLSLANPTSEHVKFV